jgi:cytochrome c oxidase cbb3-type subunit 4
MDINTLRIAATLAAFGTFLAIVGWAYARSNRARFEQDAHIPLQED